MMRFAPRAEQLFTTLDRYPALFDNDASTINLGPGDPKSTIPPHVAAAVAQAVADGHTAYTAVNGIRELRDAVAAQVRDAHGIDYDPEHICVGNGSKQLMANTFMATLDDGDEVILIAPYYSVYYQMVLLAGGRPVVVMAANGDYRLPVTEIDAAITPRTRWIILNSPNNPAGVVYGLDELAALDALLDAHPSVNVISDQIYEQLTFDGAVAPCPASVSSGARERTLIVNGVSKAYGMTGFRIGYALGPPDLIAHLKRLQYVTTSCACSVSQYAAVAALTGPQDALVETVGRYRAAAALTGSVLAEMTELVVPHIAGAMYAFVDCTAYLGRLDPTGAPISTDLELVRFLSQEAKVLVMPGTMFGSAGHLRVTYVANETELREGLRRMVTALALLRKPR